MCKIQTFGLLVVTLLLFSQESSGATDKRIEILRSTMDEIRTLRGSISTKQITTQYRMPQNIPENCSLNALACVVDKMGRMEHSINLSTKQKKLAGDITTNIQAFLEKTLQQEVIPKELCNQCEITTKLKYVKILLDDLLNLLQRVNSDL